MDTVHELLEEHRRLRRMAEQLEESVGPQDGVGWEDRSWRDPGILRRAARDFLTALEAHEKREEAAFAGLRPEAGGDAEALRGEVDRAHRTLNELSGILAAVTLCSEEGRVHAVRITARRVREELEAHLAYEERVVFPRLRRASRRAAA